MISVVVLCHYSNVLNNVVACVPSQKHVKAYSEKVLGS